MSKWCRSEWAKPTGRGSGFQTRRREFDSPHPRATQLHRDRTSWAPDPRVCREADERRGTGLTVTRPWRTPSNPDPKAGSGGELKSEQHQAGIGPKGERSPASRGDPFGDEQDASAAARLASIAAMLRTLNPESKVRFLGEARGVVRLDADTVLRTAGGESRSGWGTSLHESRSGEVLGVSSPSTRTCLSTNGEVTSLISRKCQFDSGRADGW